MGIGDKISNKTEDLGGKAKEAAGSATGDKDLEAEGKGDQASAAVKDGVEKVKDAASNIKDKLTGN
ncbi:CsbD family protein [Rhodococcus sp. 06-235-1A]|uniref:CsbD family protein n=1 Tax=Rhodococcus sp. 06-235-1A TaxID=2022508 RepID=UPI000B9B3ACF|nr:CsbD family protein [Rhodococcus sp. 06-235-1A]OZD05124.1 CsbD family protein [Rhodococcus sp. 06-235-1A]